MTADLTKVWIDRLVTAADRPPAPGSGLRLDRAACRNLAELLAHLAGLPVPATEQDPAAETLVVKPLAWTAQAHEVYAAHVGYIAFGRIGKALAPLILKYGWAMVQPWWACYCRNRPYTKANGAIFGDDPKDRPENAPPKDLRFTTPEDFTRTYTSWRDQCTPKKVGVV